VRPKVTDTDTLFTKQCLVGFTRQQSDALEMVATSMGMKTSQYIRQVAVERLVQLQLIENPMAKYHIKPAASAGA
jgi:hypothetical protein